MMLRKCALAANARGFNLHQATFTIDASLEPLESDLAETHRWPIAPLHSSNSLHSSRCDLAAVNQGTRAVGTNARSVTFVTQLNLYEPAVRSERVPALAEGVS